MRTSIDNIEIKWEVVERNFRILDVSIKRVHDPAMMSLVVGFDEWEYGRRMVVISGLSCGQRDQGSVPLFRADRPTKAAAESAGTW